jgi:hypothetical protein
MISKTKQVGTVVVLYICVQEVTDSDHIQEINDPHVLFWFMYCFGFPVSPGNFPRYHLD